MFTFILQCFGISQNENPFQFPDPYVVYILSWCFYFVLKCPFIWLLVLCITSLLLTKKCYRKTAAWILSALAYILFLVVISMFIFSPLSVLNKTLNSFACFSLLVNFCFVLKVACLISSVCFHLFAFLILAILWDSYRNCILHSKYFSRGHFSSDLVLPFNRMHVFTVGVEGWETSAVLMITAFTKIYLDLYPTHMYSGTCRYSIRDMEMNCHDEESFHE